MKRRSLIKFLSPIFDTPVAPAYSYSEKDFYARPIGRLADAKEFSCEIKVESGTVSHGAFSVEFIFSKCFNGVVNEMRMDGLSMFRADSYPGGVRLEKLRYQIDKGAIILSVNR